MRWIAMKAIEVTGKIDSEGNLILDQPIREINYPHQVRVIHHDLPLF
ncbi:hypothetical protein [Nostoc piscinale]